MQLGLTRVLGDGSVQDTATAAATAVAAAVALAGLKRLQLVIVQPVLRSVVSNFCLRMGLTRARTCADMLVGLVRLVTLPSA